MHIVCFGYLAQTLHLHLIEFSLWLLLPFSAMKEQEVKKGTEREHVVLAARPLFNFFLAQKQTWIRKDFMARYINNLHRSKNPPYNHLLVHIFPPVDKKSY